jgi:acyl-CoA synthetase (AMP-forming)/AMP-acid ligase II
VDEGIGAWVARRAARSPDAVALVDGPTGARSSYAALGVGHGDRVALLGENSPAYLEWLFAAARLGAITVPVNMRLAPPEVADMLDDSGAQVLVSVLAVVVPADPGAPPPADEVIAFARERIAHFKAPRRVEFVEELPRNATGKLLKRVLRERFAGSSAAVSR